MSFKAGAVVDSITTYTPENLLLDQNRQAFNAKDLIIFRQGNTFNINPARGGNQTISYLQLKYTDYENMVVLDNRTIFNDLIFDTITAERQNRLQLNATVSTQWDGTLNAQGFILNQNNVVAWQPNVKYTKGDIVIYKNNYWQAANIVQPKTTFDYTDWYKSNYDAIEQGLLSNLANKADQLANSYNTQIANLNTDQDLLAFGLIGFQPRQYMVDLNLSSPSQVQLYQQFIKTMGSLNAADLFTQVNFNSEVGEYHIYENWGILVGTYGANANRSWFDVYLNEALLTGNPSTIQIIQPGDTSIADQTVLLSNLWAQSYQIPTTNILPTTYDRNLDTALPWAGYVNINDVDITVFNLDDPSSIAASLTTIGNGTKIWVAQINSYDWGIYECRQVAGRLIRLSDNLNGTSQAQFSSVVNLSVGDLIIVRYFDSAVDGVYRVLSVPAIDTVVIEYAFTNTNQTSITGTGIVFYLQTTRVGQASDVGTLPYTNQLTPGATVWVDNDGSGHWEVIQKQNPFSDTQTLVSNSPQANSLYGSSISQSNGHTTMLVGSPEEDAGAGALYAYGVNKFGQYVQNIRLSLIAANTVGFGNSVNFGSNTWAVAGASGSNSGAGYAVVLYQPPSSVSYIQTQLLVAPDQDFSAIGFGSSVKISPDEYWMYIGAPGANKVYAYGRVDIPVETITYVADGVTAAYTYNTDITIDSVYPEQLKITVGNFECAYGVNYIISATTVQLLFVPVAGQRVVIARRQAAQLDFNTYYNVIQNSTTGSGSGATFTVTNTRGQYSVSLITPGVNYSIGDTLTISYTQVDPAGSSANNLTIQVTDVHDGGITEFTHTGSGVSNTSAFSLQPYLYTATNIDSFTILVNGQIQRPYIDYTFSGTTVTFLTLPPAGAVISAESGTYWKYIDTITVDGVDSDANFGASLTVDQDGRQILIGAPADTVNDNNGNPINTGAVYAIDRGVVRYLVTNTGQLTYEIPGSYIQPVAVMLNNQFLTNTNQYINGQFTVSGSNVVLSSTVELNIGDILEIETNQFQFIQKITPNTVFDEIEFGYAVDICSNNCSVYAGAPFDSKASNRTQSGMVQRQVNQSRIYGITSSTIANPTLVPQNTIRINNTEVAVPAYPNNTVAGLVNAINSSGIPNVVATLAPNVTLYGDGVTQIFDIGNIYSSAEAYTPVVYVDNVLQTYGSEYTYNNTTQQLLFVSAPYPGTQIVVVAGRMTISVINSIAAEEFNKLTVLPGLSSADSAGDISAFYDLGFVTYAYTQTIVSPNPTDYAHFGQSLSINTGAVNLVVGAPNGDVYEPTIFDGGKTYFDERSTTFFGYVTNAGVVYTFDYLPSSSDSLANPGKFVFGQQIFETSAKSNNLFGYAVDYRSGRLAVSSPADDVADNNTNYGSLLVLDNPTQTPAWQVIYAQQPMVDVTLINSVYSYNKLLNSTQTYFDYIDPLQGKILGVARQNIDYIGAVDPAGYNNGTVHNIGTSWGPMHVGEIWWDTNSVRFIDANQDNIVYASRRWGQVFPGSTIDIYQWVESPLPPASYTDTGTPLSTTSYTVHSTVNAQGLLVTNYYFWVKGITTVNVAARKTLSTTAIANYILNPLNSGLPYIAALTPNAVAIYNAKSLLSASDTILHIEYDRQFTGANADIHTEYEFITAEKPESFLNTNLYRKFLDSLCGADTLGNPVPDPALSPGMSYGVQFRPRQSMFVNRFTALSNYLSYANNILAQYPISEMCSFNLLNSAEPIPPANSGAWDFEVPNIEILNYQNLELVPLGYLYLVESDSTQNGLWTIYQVAQGSLPGELVLNLIRVQNYDTKLYWNYINWYSPGYNSSIQPVATVPNYAGLETLNLSTIRIGNSVKVADNGSGKYEIYLLTDTGWERVGLQDGTIEFSSVLWNYIEGNFGFDLEVFDAQYFDQEPVTETRQILKAINEELFIEELLIERNRALILMFQFIYTEITSPEWLIKTSYINVDHVIRGLEPIQLYQPDNQTFVLDYLNEVKPFHVQNLSFNLIYDGLDTYPGELTDYDLPAYWDTTLDVPQFVSPVLLPYNHSTSINQSSASDTASNAQVWLEQPWSNWYNNYLLSIETVTILNGGDKYTVAPTVTVTGNCLVPAQMTAIINSAGRVVEIQVNDPGEGYTTTAIITISGGNLPTDSTPWLANATATLDEYIVANGVEIYQVATAGTLGQQAPTGQIDQTNGTADLVYIGTIATATAQMGNPLVRSIKTTIKYDRYEYATSILTWEPNVAYPANTLVRWSNIVWSANSTVSGPVFVPTDWTRVDAGTLSGVDRTMGYYVPGPNMPGLSLPLLIDGVDYPGVQVQAPAFNQNTGFDVGNYDINPFDNFSLDLEGRPTYDSGILDAQYSSAYADIYLGTRPTDINVDGGGYVDPFSSHAPEELIPGSEFDTLDFRVYTTPGSDWTGSGHGFLAGSCRYTYSSLDPVLNFAGLIDIPFTVIAFNVTLGLAIEPVSYDWANYEITVGATETDGDLIDIYVTGVGGGNQLFNNTYLGTDLTNGNTLVVPFRTDYIYQMVIYNGETPLIPGADYNWQTTATTSTTITFNDTYGATDRINICILGYADNGITHSWSLPVFETVVSDGTRNMHLTNSLQGTNPANIIVLSNGSRLRPSEGIEYIGDSSTTIYALPSDGGYSQSLIADNDVTVYVDNQLLTQGVEYIVNPWDGSSARTVTIFTAPNTGSRILISVRTAAQYWILGNTIEYVNGYTPNLGDIFEIITWNDTSEQGLLTQVFVGPTTIGGVPSNVFDTGRIIANTERILVTLNGNWLFVGIGFVANGSKVVIEGPVIGSTDVVVITSFTYSVVPGPMAFRIFQDMRGVQATYRITSNTTTTLSQELLATDDVIHLTNASALNPADFSANNWGVITIDGERIMYREIDYTANTVSSLLRGTAGTAAADHTAGALVYQMGRENLLPIEYQDYNDTNNFMGDSSTTLFDTNIVINNEPIVYTGGKVRVYINSVLQDTSYYTVSQIDPVGILFNTYPQIGSTVTITVIYQDNTTQSQSFTATGSINSFITTLSIGLIKQSTSAYTVNSYDPVNITFNTRPLGGDVVYITNSYGPLQSSFSFSNGQTTFNTDINLTYPVIVYVGGIEQPITNYQVTSLNPVKVLFNTAPPEGLEVTVLVKFGVTWYHQGVDTASDGVPLQDTNTAPARFLRGL